MSSSITGVHPHSSEARPGGRSARYHAAGALLLVLTLSPVAGAAPPIDGDLNWGNCGGPLLLRQPSPPANDQRIVLEADAAELSTRKRQMVMEGNVSGTQGEMALMADRLRYDEPASQLTAEGGVLFELSGMRIAGEEAQINLENRHALMEGAEYRLLQQHARGTAGVIELLGESLSRYQEIRYTTCAPGDNGWLLEADTLEVNRESGIGEATGALLAFQGMPLFYTPYLQFPVDDRRMSGLLAPSIGGSGDTGLDITIPYYLNLAPHMDATLEPRVMSDRGVLLGGEFRHMSRFSYSDLGVEWIPEDAGRPSGKNRSRGALRFEGSGKAPADGRYRISYRQVSDSDYLSDFGDSMTVSGETHLRRRGELLYRGAGWRLVGRVESFQTVDDTIAVANRPYARLPQLLYTLNQNRLIANLGAKLQAEYVYFDRETGVTGQRLDLKPSLHYPMERAWGYLRPELSLRHTAYALDNPTAGVAAEPTRTLPTFALDGGLYLERSSEWFGRRTLQTLEPRLYFLHTPYRDQQELPTFDTSLLDLSLAGLFRDNRFIGGDRVGDANQLAAAISGRIVDEASGVERFRYGLGGIAYFDDRRVQLAGTATDRDPGSALIGEVDTRLGREWRLRAALQWNPHGSTANTERSAVQLSYHAPSNQLFNLSYRYDQHLLEQGDLSFRQSLSPTVDLVGRWNYSLRDQETMEAFAGIEYDSCCWALRTVVRRTVREIGANPNTAFFIQLELKGLAGIGNQLDSFLERGIFGYEVER